MKMKHQREEDVFDFVDESHRRPVAANAAVKGEPGVPGARRRRAVPSAATRQRPDPAARAACARALADVVDRVAALADGGFASSEGNAEAAGARRRPRTSARLGFAPACSVREYDPAEPVGLLLAGGGATVLEEVTDRQSRGEVRRRKRRRTAGGMMGKIRLSDDGGEGARPPAAGRRPSPQPRAGRPGPEQTDPATAIARHSGENSARSPRSDAPRKHPVRVALLHSPRHTRVLHAAMLPVHADRDALLASLLRCCGFLSGAAEGGPLSSFLGVVSPLVGTRGLLETFHGADYLDLLEFPRGADVDGRGAEGAGCEEDGSIESDPKAEGSGQAVSEDAGSPYASLADDSGDRSKQAMPRLKAGWRAG